MHTEGIIPAILPVHILAGGLALVFGYVALFATKGATVHRKSGMLFVYAMVTLSLSGALMDALKTSRTSVNVVAGLLTFYFVTTALLTVRRRPRESSLDRSRRDAVCADGQRCSPSRPVSTLRAAADPRRRRSSSLASSGCWQRPATAHDACRRHSGAPSHRAAFVAHVFCDVGGRRVFFLGPARQSP